MKEGLDGGESISFQGVSSALSTALENPEERFICTPDRTDNRSRSPRFAASSC